MTEEDQIPIGTIYDLVKNGPSIAEVLEEQNTEDLLSQARYLFDRPASLQSILIIETLKNRLAKNTELLTPAREIVKNASTSENTTEETLLLIGALVILHNRILGKLCTGKSQN
jgi:hypothetical protein